MTHTNNKPLAFTLLAPVFNESDKEAANIKMLVDTLLLPPNSAFNDVNLSFLSQFSSILLKEPTPELKALGFWLRNSRLKKWKQAYLDAAGERQQHVHLPIGSVMHFTPANVDTMFVYSWVCALVLGNISIVRLSRQDSPVKARLLAIINQLYALDTYHGIAKRNVFLTYDYGSDITHCLSKYVDARVIWGGDEAVENIRHIPAKPKTRDIAFSDRYSVTLIGSEGLQNNSDISQVAKQLWRDIEPYQQQACSSPKVLFWCEGEHNDLNKGKSEDRLSSLLSELENTAKLSTLVGEGIEITTRNNRLVTTQLACSEGKVINILLSGLVSVLEVDKLCNTLLEWHTGAGMLYVIRVKSPSEAFQMLDEKCQTLSYWGIDKHNLVKQLQAEPISSIDRVVPIGQALDFDVVWDGYDLMQQLERKITVL